MAEAEARYAFLHEGVLRGYLSKIGRQAGDSALYWKYGCWSYEETTDSRVLIESQWDDAESEAGAGSIRLRAWGENAETLLDPLLETLQKLPVGQPPEIKRTIALRGTARASASITAWLYSGQPVAEPSEIVRQDTSKQLDRPTQIKLEDLIFAPDPFMKDFFVSYTKTDKAWAEWIAWTLEAAGYSLVCQRRMPAQLCSVPLAHAINQTRLPLSPVPARRSSLPARLQPNPPIPEGPKRRPHLSRRS